MNCPDQFRCTNGKSNSFSGHGARLGECLYNQQILILGQQGQNRLTAKVNVGLIYNHEGFRIVFQNFFDLSQLQGNARWCVRIRENDSPVGLAVIVRYDPELLIQRLHCIGNPEQITPNRIKGICNIREQNRQI